MTGPATVHPHLPFPRDPASRRPRGPSRACYTLGASDGNARPITAGSAARPPGTETA